MSVQFGIATMTFGGVNIGYLQNVSVDFAFDVAQLYSGNAIYPVDVRTHTPQSLLRRYWVEPEQVTQLL